MTPLPVISNFNGARSSIFSGSSANYTRSLVEKGSGAVSPLDLRVAL